ncbi:DUF2358-containing protein [Aureococcus anophagefferens]|nr:DUF2358-containing protein [Aureococcus anophagefferens]
MARLLALAVVAAAYGPTKPYQRAVPSVARRTTPSRPAPLAPLSAYNSTSVPEEFNLNEVMEREREEAPVELPGAGDDFVELPKLGAAPGDGRKSPSEFELNLGEAIDALKADVPDFPDREPNYAVYGRRPIGGPTGVQAGPHVLQAVLRHDPPLPPRHDRPRRGHLSVALRLERQAHHRHVVLFLDRAGAARVDAVSYFHLNEEGRIFKHEVDRVQINGQMMNPPYSVGWLAFRQYVLQGLDGASAAARAQAWFDARHRLEAAVTDADVLFSGTDVAAEPPAKAKKAGRSKNLKKKSPLGKLMPGTCENMWDCDSPMQCCDFVLFKMCCNGGVGIPAFQPALVPIPIPVEREPYPNQPPPPGSRW